LLSGSIPLVIGNTETTSVGPMDSPWPMFGHDERHTGRSPYSTEDNPFIEKWRLNTDWVEGGLAIDNDGIIYFGDANRDLYAVYPNGTIKWTKHLNGWIWSTPAIAEDGTIYIGTNGNILFAIKPDGTEKWRFNSGGTIFCSPSIADDGSIYFGTMKELDEGEIYALYPNGTMKWVFETGDFVSSNPAIGDDGTIYIGSSDHYLYSINPNGTLKWRYKTGDRVKSHPSIADDGTVYFSSFDGKTYALNPDGSLKWTFNNPGSGVIAPVIAEDGTIYIAGDGISALNQIDGTLKWNFYLGEDIYIGHSTPAISSDGTIFVGTIINIDDGGEVIAIYPDGTERWSSGIICSNWIYSSPSIGKNGTIYIGISNNLNSNNVGGVVAFGSLDPDAPELPIIIGNTNGRYGVEQEYNLTTIDPNGDDVYYYIEWGDNKKTDWNGPYSSGEEVTFTHTYNEQGTYIIRARAKDIHNLWGDWSTLEVRMPKTRSIYDVLLDRFPLLGWLFNQILE
jgi:outer membrane protein assembly factor BamB